MPILCFYLPAFPVAFDHGLVAVVRFLVETLVLFFFVLVFGYVTAFLFFTVYAEKWQYCGMIGMVIL